jgi:hypothetical protein
MPRDRWQYQTARLEVGGIMKPKVDLDALRQELDRYGAQGWELVSALPLGESHGKTGGILCVFKKLA